MTQEIPNKKGEMKMNSRNHFKASRNHLASLGLAVILLFVAFLNAPGPLLVHATSYTLPGGSLTTADLNSWSATTFWYDTYFDFSAGPTTITMNSLDLTDVWYEGVWPWPPVASSQGAQGRFGVSGGGFWSTHMIASSIGNGGGSWDQQLMKWTHDEGFRKYLIQNQFGTICCFGNHQYNVEAYIPRLGAGPSVNDPAQVTDREYNTFDMKITYTPTGTPGTYQVQGWVRLHKAASTTEMQTRPGSPPWGSPYTWVWNKAINNQATPDAAWVPFYDGSWTVTGFQNPVRPFVQIMNWGVPQTRHHTIHWGSLVIDGTLATAHIKVNSKPLAVQGLGIVKVDDLDVTTPHTYTWIVGSEHKLEALSPVTDASGLLWVFDSWSDGGAQTHVYKVPTSDARVIAQYVLYQITATVNVDPDTLNLKSKGKWITAYVTLPVGWSVSDVDLSTVLLGTADPEWSEIQADVLMLKFDRQEFNGLIPGPVTLTIEGEMTNGQPFTGTDTITVI